MLIIDAHEDLAWNMLTFGRDYTRSVEESRRIEAGGPAPQYNGDTLLGWPEYQRGRIAIVCATLFAAPIRRQRGAWDKLVYADADQAYTLYADQVDTYRKLVDEHSDKFRLVERRIDLEDVISHWENPTEDAHPVGLVLLMEGAEGIRSPDELEAWWARGVRLIGPAWAGTRFCGGTHEPGPLTKEGYALLEGMAEFGFALDISHMDEEAALQALDYYPGAIIASHSNAATLLKEVRSNRFLSDRLLHGLIERDGIVGVVPYNKFLRWDWTRGAGRETVTLAEVVAQIDYICQLAGDARHVGLGTDFDGGFGVQDTPFEIDTIADLQKLIPSLEEKGYTEEDITAILADNWSSFLRMTLL